MADTKQDSGSAPIAGSTGPVGDVAMPVEPGATLPVTSVDGQAKPAPTDKQVEKAATTVSKTAAAVDEAQKAVDNAGKSKEQVALEKAQQENDDAKAAHAELTGAAGDAAAQPMTVLAAKVLAVVDPGTSAADWRAQKFGNDPANPQLAPGISPVENLIKLSRKTPDLPGDGMAYAVVPKEMAGDYERAGWNRT